MTNAEFLNANFGTHYKAYMKCRWKCLPHIEVWMVSLDAKERYGWKNFILDNKVIEKFVLPEDRKLPTHKTFEERLRLVVDKAQNYKILGVYRYDEINSNMKNCRIWIKEADTLKEFLNAKTYN